MNQVPALLTDPRELERLAGRLAGETVVGLDTEFVSERTYRPLLCLVSLAWREGEALVDPLALDDLAPLGRALGRPECTVILHAGGQDLPLLARHLGLAPARVFDTQVAAAFLGYGQIAYSRLVQAVLGVRLEGGSGFSEWARRPLSLQQLRYARDDARYLVPLYDALRAELERKGRLAWCEEECALMRERSLAGPSGEPWEKVDGVRRLRPRQLAVLRELAAWREEEARRANVPAAYVMRDAALVALAQQAPRDAEGVGRVRGMTSGQLKRYLPAILAAVERGRGCPRERWPRPAESPQEDPVERTGTDFLSSWVRRRAEEEGITPSLLATREDLSDLVRWRRGDRDELPRVLQGWRRSLVGQDLLELVEGRTALALVDGQLRLVPWREGT